MSSSHTGSRFIIFLNKLIIYLSLIYISRQVVWTPGLFIHLLTQQLFLVVPTISLADLFVQLSLEQAYYLKETWFLGGLLHIHYHVCTHRSDHPLASPMKPWLKRPESLFLTTPIQYFRILPSPPKHPSNPPTSASTTIVGQLTIPTPLDYCNCLPTCSPSV